MCVHKSRDSEPDNRVTRESVAMPHVHERHVTQVRAERKCLKTGLHENQSYWVSNIMNACRVHRKLESCGHNTLKVIAHFAGSVGCARTSTLSARSQ